MHPPVGIICRCVNDFWILKGVAQALGDLAEIFILSMNQANFWDRPTGMTDQIEKMVKTTGLPYRRLDNTTWDKVCDYKVSVATPSMDFLPSPVRAALANSRNIRIRIPYSYAKSYVSMGPGNLIYNVVLCPGQAFADLLKPYSTLKTHVTGTPKYDDWFAGRSEPYPDLPMGSVLYAPTWGDLSSIPQVSAIFDKIDPLLIKPHEGTLNQHNDRENSLRSMINGYRVIDTARDIQRVYKSVDMVISTKSGAMFEAMLVDKPIIVAKQPLQNGNHAGSTEYVYSYCGIQASSNDEILKTIDAYRKDPTLHHEERQRARDLCWAGRDGHAADRCAEIIKSYL